jgi:hypothetical protein
MKILLELHSETLVEFRAELEAFLGLAGNASVTTVITKGSHPAAVLETLPTFAGTGVTKPSTADIAFGNGAESLESQRPAPKQDRTKSAADIAMSSDPGGGEEEGPAGDVAAARGANPDVAAEEILVESVTTETLLADKAQLQFEFDRVLAALGRAAALGIVRGVLPPGKKTKSKDLEALPVELIPAAIAALREAGAN